MSALTAWHRQVAEGIAQAVVPVRAIRAHGNHRVAQNDEPEELADTSLQIGRQTVLSDMGLFSAWLDQQDGIREPSDYFGPISTPDLFSLVLFNRGATDAQRKAACELVMERYLSDNDPEVISVARRAQEA